MVFEEFYQVDNPERDRTKGLGLGLSIVRRLCSLLGITLELRSAGGQGTCVTLRLPLESYGTIAPPPAAPADRQSFAGLTVLVIDDERSVRLGMRVLLEELGCRFVEACSIEEAIARGARPRGPTSCSPTCACATAKPASAAIPASWPRSVPTPAC